MLEKIMLIIAVVFFFSYADRYPTLANGPLTSISENSVLYMDCEPSGDSLICNCIQLSFKITQPEITEAEFNRQVDSVISSTDFAKEFKEFCAEFDTIKAPAYSHRYEKENVAKIKKLCRASFNKDTYKELFKFLMTDSETTVVWPHPHQVSFKKKGNFKWANVVSGGGWVTQMTLEKLNNYEWQYTQTRTSVPKGFEESLNKPQIYTHKKSSKFKLTSKYIEFKVIP
jgi:hypothetical protein